MSFAKRARAAATESPNHSISGEWPAAMVDHRNGDKRDDRWANLRLATRTQNNRNTSAKGYTIGPGGKFNAQITVDRKHIHLGSYDTGEQARAAYCLAAYLYFGEYAREHGQ